MASMLKIWLYGRCWNATVSSNSISNITNACYWVLKQVEGKSKKTFSRYIAVNENPLLTISTLEESYFLMKDGKIYKKLDRLPFIEL
jgi:hypothetical protein